MQFVTDSASDHTMDVILWITDDTLRLEVRVRVRVSEVIASPLRPGFPQAGYIDHIHATHYYYREDNTTKLN